MALTLEQRTEIIGMITQAQEEVHMRAMGEVKFEQLSTGIEAKFTELRSEFGVQFATMQTKSIEVREMMDTLEIRKTAMATEIAATCDRFDAKGSEMETLID